MIGGFLKGAVLGGAVGVAGLGVLALASGPREVGSAMPDAPVVTDVTGGAVAPAPTDAATAAPEAETAAAETAVDDTAAAETAPVAAEGEDVAGDGAEPAAVADPVPSPEPEIAPDTGMAAATDGDAGTDTGPATGPATEATTGADGTAAAEPTPLAPAEVPAEAPAGTASDSASDAALAPAAQPALDTVAEQAPDLDPALAAAPETPPAPAAPGQPAAVPGAEVAQAGAPALPAVPAAEGGDAAPVSADLPPLPPLTPEEEALLAQIGQGSAESAPDVTDPSPLPAEVPANVPAVTPPEPDAAATTEPGSAPEGAAPATVDLAPGLAPSQSLAPAPGLDREVVGVTTGRLPSIGAADPQTGSQAEQQADPQMDPRPMVRFARPFDNAGQKPVYAIVLIDDGSDSVDRAALAALPFPVSFALDPLHPKAAEQAAIYRAGGQEVLMLASGIPEGAQAQDLEVAFGVMADSLPEAVAVIDLPEARFQANRSLATQVIPVVAAQGRGLVTWDRGLNAADQVARREGLPAAVAFRALDAEDESTPVVRRYLDRAAFKAAQEGRVTVVGRTRPETVAALLEWAVEGRASTVALAPVTAALRAD